MQDGKIAYVEFPGRDLPAVKRFYQEAFGWSFLDYGPTYAALQEAGLEGGFQGDLADPSLAAAPLVLSYADDLEAAEAKVRAAGGTITKAIFSFPGGRRFHYRDPAGNELGVFSAG